MTIIIVIRLEIRNAELTESRRSKSARSETVSNEEHPEQEQEEDQEEEKEEEEEEEVTEGKEVTEEEESEENEERKGRLSIALTNCGDVLERQLFDAIFWSVASFTTVWTNFKSEILWMIADF